MDQSQAKLPVLVVVSGPPATGKTALSRRLAEEFGLPLLGRDGLKEILFDSLGAGDRAWSRLLGGASYELLFYAAEALLKTSCPFILESNFLHEHNSARVRALAEKYAYFPYQILCRCDPATALERMRQRSASGERHPGHVEQSEIARLDASQLVGATAPLDIGGRLVELDTNDFAQIDYLALFGDLRATLAPTNRSAPSGR